MIVIGVVALVIRVLKESEDRSTSDGDGLSETEDHRSLEKSVKVYTAGSFPEATSLNRLLKNKDIIRTRSCNLVIINKNIPRRGLVETSYYAKQCRFAASGRT